MNQVVTDTRERDPRRHGGSAGRNCHPAGETPGSENPWLQDQILEHIAYANEHGVDRPEIRNWKWTP